MSKGEELHIAAVKAVSSSMACVMNVKIKKIEKKVPKFPPPPAVIHTLAWSSFKAQEKIAGSFMFNFFIYFL